VELVDRAVFIFSILVAFLGAARLARQVGALAPSLSRLMEHDADDDIAECFRGIGSMAGPLALTLLSAVVFAGESLAQDGWSAAAVTAVTWLLIGPVLWTLFWVYASVQIGLDRLGRRRLALDAFAGDRSLGLWPLGHLAFTGFWIFAAVLAPLLIRNLGELVSLVSALVVSAAGIAVFFLSLWRLHGQMVVVKQEQLNWSRDLYGRIYAPIRVDGSVEALDEQGSRLSAAEVLRQHAEAIQEWPFDAATFLRVVTIATSVAAVVIGRLIFLAFGL
jgi:hypothetical protein